VVDFRRAEAGFSAFDAAWHPIRNKITLCFRLFA